MSFGSARQEQVQQTVYVANKRSALASLTQNIERPPFYSFYCIKK